MARDARDAIAALLAAAAPASLLLLSPDRGQHWRTLCAQHAAAIIAVDQQSLAALEQVGRVDMALVIGLLEQTAKDIGEQVIGRLRNVHTDHVYVLVGNDPRWRATDCFALALQRIETVETDGGTLTLYGYDLATYNRPRSWNNPKFWANPDNWNRYRW